MSSTGTLTSLCSVQVVTNAMYVAQMAFFARVSDPRMGGSYMTLLNTLTNLGSKVGAPFCGSSKQASRGDCWQAACMVGAPLVGALLLFREKVLLLVLLAEHRSFSEQSKSDIALINNWPTSAPQ
jgi:hypothetical protein